MLIYSWANDVKDLSLDLSIFKPFLKFILNAHLFHYRAFIYEYFLFAYINLIGTEILRLPQCNKVDGKFSEIHRNQRLIGSVIKTFKDVNIGGCISQCLKFPECKSVNFLNSTSVSVHATGVCELNSAECDSSGISKLKQEDGSTYIQTPKMQPNVSS